MSGANVTGVLNVVLLPSYYNGGRPLFGRTNLMNCAKNSQWTFTKVPSAIRWVTFACTRLRGTIFSLQTKADKYTAFPLQSFVR